MTKSRHLLASSALVVLALGLSWVAGEIAFRLLGIEYPIFSAADPTGGWSHRPGAAGWQTKEGKAYVEINDFGFRDRPRSLAKPENTLRIALLGDSMAEGRQVDLDETFGALIEQELQSCLALGGRRIEVLNFAVSGYGTAHQLLQLREQIWPFEPDLVLLAFFAGNDIRNNSRALFNERASPYFLYDGDQLSLDRSFVETSSFKLRNSFLYRFVLALSDHSRITQAALHVFRSYRRSRVKERYSEQAEIADLGIDAQAYGPAERGPWHEAWVVTEAMLVEMQRDVSERAVPFAVTPLPSAVQVSIDTAWRKAFRDGLGVEDLFFPERRLQALGRRAAIPVWPIAQEMLAAAEARQTYFHGFPGGRIGRGHFNEAGHRLVADILSPKLCAALVDHGG